MSESPLSDFSDFHASSRCKPTAVGVTLTADLFHREFSQHYAPDTFVGLNPFEIVARIS